MHVVRTQIAHPRNLPPSGRPCPTDAPLGDGQKSAADELDDIVAREALEAVFQPILDIRTGQYFGFEGLIRGPANSRFHLPAELFFSARAAGKLMALERAARRTIVRRFSELGLPGRLFLNVSPSSLCEMHARQGEALAYLRQHDLHPGRIVLEITENEHLADVGEVLEAITYCRSLGLTIALDDLGEGFANLRMWSEVHPEIIKIDRHFIDGIARDRLKLHFVRAMQTLAESCSALMVAEGVEKAEDLYLLRDLGIALAQGYLIERPSAVPCLTPGAEIRVALRAHRKVVVSHSGAAQRLPKVVDLMKPVMPVQATSSNAEVLERFKDDPFLAFLPVVRGRVPAGLISRDRFFDFLARPFRYDLIAKKPCTSMLDPHVIYIEGSMTLQELGLKLSRDEKSTLEGFVVVDAQGAYVGVASGRDVMAVMTEMQIVAARHANPLTQLPGNVPINEHIGRLLECEVDFAACYVDINHFKPLNDQYGYARGDAVIEMSGAILVEACDAHLDFVGHIGGDDFMVLFQSTDWVARCEAILRRFDTEIRNFLDADDIERGGIVSESRSGEIVQHPLPSLAIGAVLVTPGKFKSHHAVAAAASTCKKEAKKYAGSQLFIERRNA